MQNGEYVMNKINTTARNIKADAVIIGSGVAGLYCALNLPKDWNLLLITKDEIDGSDSYLAQGGICVLKNEDDYDSYFEDTMRAGHYENNKRSVEIMIRSSQDIISDLISYGVDFARNEDGSLRYTREGAHSTNRILFHEDITGKEITSTLLKRVQDLENVTIVPHMTMVDIISDDRNQTCSGIICRDENQNLHIVEANYTVMACGGIGGLYTHSTNFRHLTGDGLAIALKHQVKLQNPDYIQIHPTTLYSTKPGRRFLISESVRGEGALLLNAKMERFVDELLPRDVVAKAIYRQMELDHTDHVWLSLAPIDKEVITNHFPNIYKHCLEEGYDVTKEPIPVVPAQHYFMGGIDVDEHSKTSMDQLYAVGETSCNGVHGANRLASNSLLESLVFAKRAALEMKENFDSTTISDTAISGVDLSEYDNYEKLCSDYHDMVRKEIERMRKVHEQHNNEIKRG